MKTTIFKNMAAAAIFALGLASAVSCDKDTGKDKGEEKNYTIELADPLDKDVIIDTDNTADVTIGLKLTDLTKDQLIIDQGGQEWCYASFSADKDEIILKHGENTDKQDLVAEFTVSANIEGVEPLKFKATKRGREVNIFIKISSDNPDFIVEEKWGMQMMSYIPSCSSPKPLTLTMLTNSSSWNATVMSNSLTDDDGNEILWYKLDKTNGRNGEELTIIFDNNSSTKERMLSLNISAGNEYKSITINQDAIPATEANVSIDNTPVTGVEYILNVPKEGIEEFEKSFNVNANGSVEVKTVTSGTSTETEADWLNCSGSMGYYSIMVDKNDTTTERTVDLIVVGKGSDKELFRFKITQAAE